MESAPLTTEEIETFASLLRENNNAHLAKGMLIGALTVVGSYAIGYGGGVLFIYLKDKKASRNLAKAGHPVLHLVKE